MSCFKQSGGKWLGIESEGQEDCDKKGGKWFSSSPSSLTVEDPTVCSTLATGTFLACSTHSWADAWNGFRTWNQGSGTRLSDPPSETDILPNEYVKRVQNILTTNNRHYYLGIYIALFIFLFGLIVRMLTE